MQKPTPAEIAAAKEEVEEFASHIDEAWGQAADLLAAMHVLIHDGVAAPLRTALADMGVPYAAAPLIIQLLCAAGLAEKYWEAFCFEEYRHQVLPELIKNTQVMAASLPRYLRLVWETRA